MDDGGPGRLHITNTPRAYVWYFISTFGFVNSCVHNMYTPHMPHLAAPTHSAPHMPHPSLHMLHLFSCPLRTPHLHPTRNAPFVHPPHLNIILRVPVRVIDDDGVGGGEIDPQSSGTSAQQEDKAIAIRPGESVNGRLSQCSPHLAINPLVEIPDRKEVFGVQWERRNASAGIVLSMEIEQQHHHTGEPLYKGHSE